MRIVVTMESGEKRIVDLEPPLFVHHGVNLDYVGDGNGVDHYFTKDGYYDGWGTGVSGAREER